MGATGTDEHIENGTAELNSRQIDAARMLALEPDRTKESVASSLKISRRTIFRWLSDARFQKKIEEFRRSKMVANDAKSVLRMLSAKEKRDLFLLLLEEKENSHLNLPEIEELESRIMRVADNDNDPLHEKTRNAVRKVELLLGRLRRNALHSRDYNPDGTLVERSQREFVDDFLEDMMIAAKLAGDRRLAGAIADASRLIDQLMGEQVSRDWYKDEEDHDRDLSGWDDEIKDKVYDGEPVDSDHGLEGD